MGYDIFEQRVFFLFWIIGLFIVSAIPVVAEPLRIVATTSDLGDIARTVGGVEVKVIVLAKPSEDPHFVQAKPSFMKALADADVFIQNGLDLEVGWVPVLLRGARNGRIAPGSPGFIDASEVISPLEKPSGPVDRSFGDVHPFGNPHYLLDPVNGVRVAELIRERLSSLRPERSGEFAVATERFRREVGERLVGRELAQEYDPVKLAELFEYGQIDEFLESQGDLGKLGGWLGELARYRGVKAVTEHGMWPYFARRFGLYIVATLEPKPGIPPTSRHLEEVVNAMQREHIQLILTNPYYDPRHARFVAEKSGARIAAMAHTVGARPEARSYVEMVDTNVRAVREALSRPFTQTSSHGEHEENWGRRVGG